MPPVFRIQLYLCAVVIRAFIDNAEIISLGTVIMRALPYRLSLCLFRCQLWSLPGNGKALQSLLLSWAGKDCFSYHPLILNSTLP